MPISRKGYLKAQDENGKKQWRALDEEAESPRRGRGMNEKEGKKMLPMGRRWRERTV